MLHVPARKSAAQRLRLGISARHAVGEHLLDVKVHRAAAEASERIRDGSVVGEVNSEMALTDVAMVRGC